MRKYKKLMYIVLIVVVLLFAIYYFLINYSFHFLTEMLLSDPDKLNEFVSDMDSKSQDISNNLDKNYVENNNTENSEEKIMDPVSGKQGKNSSINETTDEHQESESDRKNDNTYQNKPAKDVGLINGYNNTDSSLKEKIEKNVSIEDKREALKLVMSKLTNKDISFLISLAKGGLTGKEKDEAVKLAYKRFTPEEINKIKALYNKYIFLLDN
ncbi:MAG: hypothetical protein QME46_01870 [Thermoanaerobacteraceae bacterium]|nr:hypothetical protein [Thermoanaerobacteraceae bacterium]